MENSKKLSREELKNIVGGKWPIITYTCNDGTTYQSGGVCDPASNICYSDGGVAFCNS